MIAAQKHELPIEGDLSDEIPLPKTIEYGAYDLDKDRIRTIVRCPECGMSIVQHRRITDNDEEVILQYRSHYKRYHLNQLVWVAGCFMPEADDAPSKAADVMSHRAYATSQGAWAALTQDLKETLGDEYDDGLWVSAMENVFTQVAFYGDIKCVVQAIPVVGTGGI